MHGWLCIFRLRPAARRLAAAVGIGWAVASCSTLLHAATFTSTTLATLPANSGSASFTASDSPGLVMTVLETASATMIGSDLFGYEGLWLGADGTGGRYAFSFSTPVNSISFSFIALTAFAGGPLELLNTFVASVATTAVLSAADGTTSWNGSVLTPLEEDSHSVLTLTAAPGASFSSIRFDHVQPEPLQGFVVDRVSVVTAAVPEPSKALLLAGGLLSLWLLRRQRSRQTLDG